VRRRIPTGFLVILFLVISGLFGYLALTRSAVQSANPIATVVAASVSPGLLLGVLALVLVFIVAIVALSIRSGRSVRINRDGLTIGGRRR
jgi:hypothetical protein